MKKYLFFFTQNELLKKLGLTIKKQANDWNSEVAFFDGNDWTFQGVNDSIIALQDELIILLMDNLSKDQYKTFIDKLNLQSIKFVFVTHTEPPPEVIDMLKTIKNSTVIPSKHAKNDATSKYLLLTKYLAKEEYKSKTSKFILPPNLSIEDFIHLIETDALPVQNKWLQMAIVTRNIQDRVNQGCKFTIEENPVSSRNNLFNTFKDTVTANTNGSSLNIQSVKGNQTYSDIFDWYGLNDEFKSIISSSQNWDSFETKIQNKLTEILTK